MLKYFLKRLGGMIPTMLIVAVFVFSFVHFLPGDPARLAAGPEADDETVAMVRHDLGLDLPLHQQFVRFLGGAVTGDFGTSIRTQRPVIDEIADRFGTEVVRLTLGGNRERIRSLATLRALDLVRRSALRHE